MAGTAGVRAGQRRCGARDGRFVRVDLWQDFVFDRKEGDYYWWHRRPFCVRFKAVAGVVSDATERPPREWGLKDDGDDDY